MPKAKLPEVVNVPTADDRQLYFDNNKVEDLLFLYVSAGCTHVGLRDKIMSHAEELIRQIIRAHNLHRIYPGREESAFGDLFQCAWIQIEKTLYKYRARPHCAACYNLIRPQDSLLYNPQDTEYGILSPEEVYKRKLKCPGCSAVVPKLIVYRGTSKVFNLWSQVARTVILAYIKKEGRDYKNSEAYKGYLDTKDRSNDDKMCRFLSEAQNIFKYNVNQLKIIDAIKHIVKTDDKPYEGIIGKLVKHSGQSRAQVACFLRIIRLRSDEFSDSPLNEESSRKIPYARGHEIPDDD